jgi:hypothetical protein
MDMARKFIQMGVTRARRYANHASGRKYDAKRRELPRVVDETKAASAEIFREYYEKAKANGTYARLRDNFLACVSTTSSSGPKILSAPSSSSSKRLASRPSS